MKQQRVCICSVYFRLSDTRGTYFSSSVRRYPCEKLRWSRLKSTDFAGAGWVWLGRHSGEFISEFSQLPVTQSTCTTLLKSFCRLNLIKKFCCWNLEAWLGSFHVGTVIYVVFCLFKWLYLSVSSSELHAETIIRLRVWERRVVTSCWAAAGVHSSNLQLLFKRGKQKNTRQTKIWWAPHLHVSPPQKKINNAWPVAWTNSRTQSDFFSAGSLSLCICNSKSARGDLNEENLLCPPGQRLVQKSGSQLNPLLTPCHLPGSFSFSPGLAGDPSEALFAAGAAKNLLGEMKVAQRKNQPTTANVSFRPVWTNQEQICHLVFSLHAKLHQSERQNKAREKNHLSEADQRCQDINDVWRRGRSFSSLFQSDVCLFSLQGSFLLLKTRKNRSQYFN